MRRMRWILVAAALAALMLPGAARASEPTGSFLGAYYENGGLWGVPSDGGKMTGLIAALRTEYLDREVDFSGGSESFTSFRLGPELTFSYRKWFLTGSYLHSVTSEDLAADETSTWGYNVHLGYATSVGKNLILAPMVGLSAEYTELDSKKGNFSATEGVRGLTLGFQGLYTLPFDRMRKPYPRWQVVFGFLYAPWLCVSDDFGSDIDGDDGWSANLGLRYNLSRRSSLSLGGQYRRTNLSSKVTDVRISDWSVGLTYGLELRY